MMSMSNAGVNLVKMFDHFLRQCMAGRKFADHLTGWPYGSIVMQRETILIADVYVPIKRCATL